MADTTISTNSPSIYKAPNSNTQVNASPANSGAGAVETKTASPSIGGDQSSVANPYTLSDPSQYTVSDPEHYTMSDVPPPVPTEPTTTVPPTVPVKPSETDPKYDNFIEVAGSGMGADKKFKLLPGELLALAEILGKTSTGMGQGNLMSLEQVQKALAERGYNTTIKDGAIVSSDGRTLITDTNGNGMLDSGDLNFAEAMPKLKEYFKDQADKMKVFNMVFDMLSKASDYSKEGEKKQEGGSTAGGGGYTTSGPTGGGTVTVAPSATTVSTLSEPPKTLPEVKPEPKAEAKPEPKPEPKAEAKPEVKKTEPKKEEPKTKDYIVKSGDWLIKIAKEHGVTLDDIKKANPDLFKDAKFNGHMRDSGGNKIWPGDVVKIPVKS